MRNALARFYLFQALEFAGYCLALVGMAFVMAWLAAMSPAREPMPLIVLSLLCALIAGVRAWQMFRNFRRSRANALARAIEAANRRLAEKQRARDARLAWAERLRSADVATMRLDARDKVIAAAQEGSAPTA